MATEVPPKRADVPARLHKRAETSYVSVFAGEPMLTQRTFRMRRLGWLIGAIWLAAGAAAQDLPGDPAAGASLAREVCANCHVVAEDQMIDPGIGPSLLEVADHPATTEMSLRAFLQTPHPTMPNLMLGPEESDDIIAYLLALKGE